MAPLEILVVGCGVAGPCLAALLLLAPGPAAHKPHVTILERSSSLRAQGQNVDVRGAGVTVIRKLGLETAVRASTTGEKGLQFVDSEGRVRAEFPADPSGSIQTPTSDIEILRGRLAEICWKRCKLVTEEVEREGGAGVSFVFGDYLEELEQDGDKVHVRFAKSGLRQSFDLVVGADGLQSRTRKMVWGVEGEKERVYRLGMYGGFFSMPRAKAETSWWQWFHAPGRRGIMLRPDDQGNRSTAFMSVINDRDERLASVAAEGQSGVEAQKKLLAECFRDAGWKSDLIVQEMKSAKDFYYDMVAQVKMDCWSKGRVVLLGDAGYCASPISGMGTTLALNGAYNLAGALTRHLDEHTVAFAEYEEKMRPLVKRAQSLIPGAPHIANPETAWGIRVMHLIMGLVAWSRVANLVFMLIGPPANAVPVEEYGFRQPSEKLE